MKLIEQRSELRGMSVDDLQHKSTELEEQVFRLKIQRATGQVEVGNKIRPLRKTLARVKTVLREKGVKD